ncbi:MAG: TRAFs-binding domain-containing protein, partial [Xanthobacteraceae bacterium]|nr:TRAFs-binding domain-containing protein [Xanthobacteraceae bacterium]
LGALACARMGAIGEAEKWLGQVDPRHLGDSTIAADFWSLAGRIAKERYSAAASDRPHSAALDFAHAALDCYRRAFGISGSAYPAVNAATMAMLSGDQSLARSRARQALSALGTGGDQWHHATSGEARLLLGEIDAARAHYAEAHRLAGNRFGDIASMRRQLLLIGSSAALDLLHAVPAPRIIAFSGHMIDHAARTWPRFPAGLEPKVASALRGKLDRLGPSVGYAQAACGADILFLEAMQEAGMQTQIVLPCAEADFIEASVSVAGVEWRSRFERVLGRATRVVLATEEAFLGDDVLFEHAANLIQGMAFLRARELSTQPLLLTVCEPGSVEVIGGTAATAQVWKSKGGHVDNIDLAALRGGDASRRDSHGGHDSVTRSVQSATPRSLKSLLFADISGFSRMPEQHTPEFVGMFLRTCKRVLDSLDHPAVDANTRGDALFIVFERPAHAAEFAVRLLQALSTVDWPAFGLAPDTSVRIGLHTGPVYGVFDPVMSKTTFYGTHVNRAARLEPIVQPGQIFATEAFAASLIAEGEKRFRCDYIGAMPLAKRFGEARLYRLHS